MFYLIVFFILLLFCVLEQANLSSKSKRILRIVSAILLICIAGLRYETGGDWDTYAKSFEKIKPISAILAGAKIYAEFETGFVLLCSIVKQFGGTLQTVYFMVALLNITLITCALRRYTKYVVLGLFVYYCVLYFSLEMIYTRQSIAVAISFYALRYIKEKNIIKYILLILCAFFFHRMALMMLPMYFIFDRKFSALFLFIVVLVGAVFMFMHIPIIKGIFLSVSGFLGDNFVERANYYMTNSRFGIARGLSVGFVLNFLIFILVLLLKEKIEKLEYGIIFTNMFVLSLIIYYFGYEIIEVSNRFRLFFLIAIIVVIPLIFESFSLFTNRFIFIFPLALYCFMFSFGVFLENDRSSAYNPYQNYLIYKWTGKESSGKQRLKESEKHFNQERKNMR